MGIGIAIAICIVTGLLAARRGYNFFLWMFAGGVVGLLVLVFLPDVGKKSKVSDEDEKHRLVSTGNRIGGGISAFAIVAMVILLFGAEV